MSLRSSSRSRRYRFGDFVLDPALRELRRGDAVLTPPPKVFDCIVYLVQHRDRAVGRDELIAAVWGRADTQDNVLAQIVLRARRLLSDGGEPNEFIRTVAGFGYRWSGEVTEEDGAPAASSLRDTDAVPETVATTTARDDGDEAMRGGARRRAKFRLAAIAAALVTVAMIGTVWWIKRGAPDDRRAESPTSTAPIALTAVLPLAVDASSEDAWARLGLMDLLAQRLAEAGAHVVPSASVMQAVPPAFDASNAAAVDDVAQTLEAGLLIGGRVTRDGARWSVEVASLKGVTPPIHAIGTADDIIGAANAAAAQLVVLMGLDGSRLHAAEMGDRRFQEVEAAILADQVDTARKLIESAPAAEANSPRLRYQLARIDLTLLKLDEARSILRAIVDAPAGRDDPLLRAKALITLSAVELRAADYRAAENYTDAAIAILRDLPQAAATNALGGALIGRATARFNQQRFEPALDDFAEARLLLASIGNNRLLGAADINIGNLYLKQDRFADAIAPLEHATKLFQRLRSPVDELMALINLECARLPLFLTGGDDEAATRLADLVDAVPDPEMKAYGQMMLTEIALAHGRLGDARMLLDGLASAGNRADLSARQRAQMHGLDARASLEMGDAWRAFDSSTAALAAPWQAEEPRDFARTWLARTRAARALGRAADAGTWEPDLRFPVTAIYAALIDAEREAATGTDDAVPDAHYQEALRLAERGRVPLDIVAVASSYARWLIGRNELARATAVIGRTAAWAPVSFEATLTELALYRRLGNDVLWRQTLERAQALAGERAIPPTLREPPSASAVSGL